MADEIRQLGKVYLENLIYNPILLIRKKIKILLEFNNKTYTRGDLNGSLAYKRNDELKYYVPYVDKSQFWTFESNYTTETRAFSRDILDVEVELEITDEAATDYDNMMKLSMVSEVSLYFNNLTADMLKQWVYFKNYSEIALAAFCLLFNVLTRYICLREGKTVSLRIGLL